MVWWIVTERHPIVKGLMDGYRETSYSEVCMVIRRHPIVKGLMDGYKKTSYSEGSGGCLQE